MTSKARSAKSGSDGASSNRNIVSLDIGTSSVRSLLFDENLTHRGDIGEQIKYEPDLTPDGGVEFDANHLFDATVKVLDVLHKEMDDHKLEAAAVGASSFWHSFLGIDENSNPTTCIIHLFDIRSGPQVDELRKLVDVKAAHQRTGCVLHTSYWPAKLLWLEQNRPEQVKKTHRWLSFSEYLMLRLHGKAPVSTSMMSGSGIWNQTENRYDDEMLKVLHLDRSKLAEDFDQPCTGLKPEWAKRWPKLAKIPWFPAYGDGAVSNVGSGCTTKDRLALMVGTSGALRLILKEDRVTVGDGLWCYRVTRDRYVVGGALSNGGEVFKWAQRTLQLPEDAEQQLVGRDPGAHGLTLLPYFSGERSPYWRPDLRAALTGMSVSTTPVDILQAALEGVSLRFRQMYDRLTPLYGTPKEVVTTGGGLQHSPIWPQMMTDALGRETTACLEPEASARGAAMLVAEQLGFIDSIDDVDTRMGETLDADKERCEKFQKLLGRDEALFEKLYL